MVIRRKSDKNKQPTECRFNMQFQHERANQEKHDQRRDDNPDHDPCTCWCCCADCMDMAWLHLPRKGIWWVPTANGELRMMPGNPSPESPGSAEISPS